MKINVVTVTYGERFDFLKKTLDAVISDSKVDKIILVDNGSSNGTGIDSYIKNDSKNKIVLIRNKENRGSAGGYKAGIAEARKNVSDYVLLLDDDNVMEDGWSDYFLNALNNFPNKEKIVLKANRDDNFCLVELPSEKDKALKVDIFKKINELFKKTKKPCTFHSTIYMPFGAFSYGGTFLPFKAIEETELPFEPFYLYYDDTEYLYRVKQKGYKAYLLNRPINTEVDQTFSDDSKFLTSFDKKASLTKIYFRIRNQYAIALMTKSQSKISLFLNGFLVILGKIAYAFIKLGINKLTLERSRIIFTAFLDGISLKFNTEEAVKKYTR